MGLGMKKSLIHHLGYPNTIAWKCYSKEWSWPSNTTSMMIAQLRYLQKGSKYMQFTSYKYPFLRVHIYICQHFLSSHLAFMSDGNRFFSLENWYSQWKQYFQLLLFPRNKWTNTSSNDVHSSVTMNHGRNGWLFILYEH